ncbi:hypothetical protein [Faecalibacterium gallinarum]|uniref:hypothetical protein n=1 Tax=Faecalibacterium gallinarum TaxID=2903556 RepID=UPI001EE3548D|nr:hypothetical protein [Faecalibacterium gallinarum]
MARTADKTEKRKFSPAKTFSERPKEAFLLPKNTDFDGRFYLPYNQRKILVLKTWWKKWKTTRKTPDFSQKGSGKPGGKS